MKTRIGRGRPALLLAALALLGLAALVSLMAGSNPIPIERVIAALLHPDEGLDTVVVVGQRVPRTLLVVVVGAALGVAGALVQALTRNPLADPGVLGINAGAALAVVLGVVVAGVMSTWVQLWLAFAGAALASVAVHRLAGSGRADGGPVRLALAGVAISMAVSAWVQTLLLADQHAFNEFRFWASGSVEGRGPDVVVVAAVAVTLGMVLAFSLAPALNVLALGEDAGRSLGVRTGTIRALTMVAVAVLAGAATAAAGPLLFVGLGVPYLARAVVGSDQRWVLPLTALLAPILLLAADVLARVVIAPQEVPVGVTVALLGGPAFIAIVRRRRIEAL